MDSDWGHVAWWALSSTMAGMMFAAVRYATGSLWLTIFLHMFVNLCMIYSNIEPVTGAAAMQVTERAVNVFELVLAAFVIASERASARAASARGSAFRFSRVVGGATPSARAATAQRPSSAR